MHKYIHIYVYSLLNPFIFLCMLVYKMFLMGYGDSQLKVYLEPQKRFFLLSTMLNLLKTGGGAFEVGMSKVCIMTISSKG